MELYLLTAMVILAFLSFANGANDVSKAIATLAGARVTSIKKAVLWGTLWTLLGSVSGLYWGTAIIKNITENIYTAQPDFSFSMALAIGLAPALWVIAATRFQWPVSTTHAVVGGLLGAGMAALGTSGVAWQSTFYKIALPLLASPLMAIGLAYALSPLLQRTAALLERIRFCLLPSPKFALVQANQLAAATTMEPQNCIVCDCDSQEAQTNHNIALSVNHMHWLTSGLLSFSRGLNDTPKLIAVILPFLLAGNMGKEAVGGMFMVSAVSMAAGGFLVGGRITEVLGFRVTEMNHTQGFSANAVATFLVLFASKLGLPVSTTHVSACSIMGQGMADGHRLNKKTVGSMLFAWLVTVPVSGIVAMAVYYLWHL